MHAAKQASRQPPVLSMIPRLDHCSHNGKLCWRGYEAGDNDSKHSATEDLHMTGEISLELATTLDHRLVDNKQHPSTTTATASGECCIGNQVQLAFPEPIQGDLHFCELRHNVPWQATPTERLRTLTVHSSDTLYVK